MAIHLHFSVDTGTRGAEIVAAAAPVRESRKPDFIPRGWRSRHHDWTEWAILAYSTDTLAVRER